MTGVQTCALPISPPDKSFEAAVTLMDQQRASSQDFIEKELKKGTNFFNRNTKDFQRELIFNVIEKAERDILAKIIENYSKEITEGNFRSDTNKKQQLNLQHLRNTFSKSDFSDNLHKEIDQLVENKTITPKDRNLIM